MKPFRSDNIYFAAKDGMPLVIYSLLSSVEEHIRAAAINNVNRINFYYYLCFQCNLQFVQIKNF